MSDVDRLLSDYIAEHRGGGEADPVEYLDRLAGADREELAALIDAYLQRAPGRGWDAEGYRGSAAERLVEGLDRSFRGRAGMWPSLLPRLRNRAQIKRRELIEALAERLGVGDRTEKVAGYYNQMEQGTLESAGVSDHVLDALSGLVGVGADALRRAGEPLGERPASGDAAVFARTAQLDADYAPAEERLAPPEAPRREEEPDWDEVDELFRGRTEK